MFLGHLSTGTLVVELSKFELEGRKVVGSKSTYPTRVVGIFSSCLERQSESHFYILKRKGLCHRRSENKTEKALISRLLIEVHQLRKNHFFVQ